MFAGKENSFSLGEYPAVKVAAARAEMLKIKGRLAAGIDPGVFRKMEKEKRSGENSFTMVAREWIALKNPCWSPSHKPRIRECCHPLDL
ncbi:MAG: Arm DNA-binding domain-containing protein [Desulfobulbaceae bacterium]|nr:Arm DNA-binding domain-containing protein [Desulfobulbaceae bacterium]